MFEDPDETGHENSFAGQKDLKRGSGNDLKRGSGNEANAPLIPKT